jgi:hypothetical protein
MEHGAKSKEQGARSLELREKNNASKIPLDFS